MKKRGFDTVQKIEKGNKFQAQDGDVIGLLQDRFYYILLKTASNLFKHYMQSNDLLQPTPDDNASINNKRSRTHDDPDSDRSNKRRLCRANGSFVSLSDGIEIKVYKDRSSRNRSPQHQIVSAVCDVPSPSTPSTPMSTCKIECSTVTSKIDRRINQFIIKMENESESQSDFAM